ncbi:MAG: phosphopantetheine-binding protein [Opitutales bacterium]|jgi:acyl carrier protein
MTDEEKLERLQIIFREVLDRPGLRLTEDFSAADCPEWDSVATVQIVLAIEAELEIRVPMEAVAKLERVSDLMLLMP